VVTALGGARLSERRQHPYETSHPLLAVEAELDDGTSVPAVLKLAGHVDPVKPQVAVDPERELAAYRVLFPDSDVTAPRLLANEGSTLLLERIEGRPLWQSGDVADWCEAARAAAQLHETLRDRVDEPFLLRYDHAFYETWFRRACAGDPSLVALERAHRRAVERLLAEPQVVIHGELYPSNVIVTPERAWLVDWESVAAGPAVVDLAALACGASEDDQAAIIAAYGGVDPVALASARLHLALRWLGWSPAWQPPPEHAFDWRTEAIAAACRLERDAA
jgi:streptomycin 6-kinase